MTLPRQLGTRLRPRSTRRRARIGIYGLLGSGNIGNDGSLDAMLGFLREHHPDAALECLCPGPEDVSTRYGLAARRLNWYRDEYQTAARPSALATKALAKIVDAFRIMAWVRRFDIILVPGSGILESALTVRPWDRPYSLFLVCASGRLVRTKVALVGVGAGVCAQPVTRWLLTSAARLARYRSFRDHLSKDAIREMGVRAEDDPVYTDLAFALPTPPANRDVHNTVGVGVMEYRGGNNDRARATEVYSTYLDKMRVFVRWLVDHGYRVVLLTGDRADSRAADSIVSRVRRDRPDLGPSRVVATHASSLTELMRQMSPVETVVATRYHNVLCALKMEIPTISIGYAEKNAALMTEMGLGEFAQSVHDLDVALLIKQFTELRYRSDELRRLIAATNRAQKRVVNQQFTDLSDHIRLGGTVPVRKAH